MLTVLNISCNLIKFKVYIDLIIIIVSNLKIVNYKLIMETAKAFTCQCYALHELKTIWLF